MRRRRSIVAFVGLLVLTATAGAGLASPAADDRFLAGLRQRRLFHLAESFCRQQLRRSGLSDERRAALVIELAQTCTDHALQATGPERERLWREALAAAQDFIQQEPGSPRLVLVQVQRAVVQSSHAGALLGQREQGAAVSLEEIHALAREAIAQLQAAAGEVTRQLQRKRQGEVNGPGMLTAAELTSLQRHVQFELAQALLDQARSYPPASPDRLSALSQADEILSPLAGRDQADELVWSSRLAQIAVSRLSGDAASMRDRLAQLETAKPPTEIMDQARAEQVWADLEAGRVAEALKTVATHVGDPSSSPQWNYAVLAAYVAAWRKASEAENASEATAWQAKAAKAAETIERDFGPPWSRQAEMLLAGAATGSAGTGESAVLIKAAETYFRAGRNDEALAAYDRAKALAQHDRQPQAAFDAGFTAAAIEHQRQHFAEASRRFRTLSLEFPEQDRAAEAHLLAAFDAAQLTGGNATKTNDPKVNDSKAVDAYAALLAEQIERWPEAASTQRARLWLGKLQASRRQWEAAIATYRAIPAPSVHAAEAIEAIGRCWPAWLAEQQAAGGNTAELARAAGEYFYGLAAPGGQLPQQWSAAQQAAALAAARIWLEYTDDRFALAEPLLRALVASVGSDEVPWQPSASALLALALAGQGHRDEAGRVISQLPAAGEDASALLVLIDGLVRLAKSAADPQRRELGELALQACENLIRRPGGLTDEQRQSVGLARAQALAAMGRLVDAREALATLARDFPRNATIERQYATALTEGHEPADLHAALDRWRQLEQSNRPGTEAWFRAKYGLALAHYKLGNHERAARLIELTQVLHPELGGGALKAQFEALLKQCREPPGTEPLRAK